MPRQGKTSFPSRTVVWAGVPLGQQQHAWFARCEPVFHSARPRSVRPHTAHANAATPSVRC